MTVITTRARRMSASGMDMMSSERTVKSAILPTSMLPRSFSWNAAYARPLGPQAARRKVEIADRVRRLHRGNDSELRESRNVAGTQDLRVLDAPTRCSDRPPLYGHAVECLLVEVQHDAIAPVSYGVRLDL